MVVWTFIHFPLLGNFVCLVGTAVNMCIIHEMPMHLVQELNVGAIGFKYFSIRVFFLNISLFSFYCKEEVVL